MVPCTSELITIFLIGQYAIKLFQYLILTPATTISLSRTNITWIASNSEATMPQLIREPAINVVARRKKNNSQCNRKFPNVLLPAKGDTRLKWRRDCMPDGAEAKFNYTGQSMTKHLNWTPENCFLFHFVLLPEQIVKATIWGTSFWTIGFQNSKIEHFRKSITWWEQNSSFFSLRILMLHSMQR